MAWQKVEVPRGGRHSTPKLKVTANYAVLNRAARDLLGGPGKTYHIFVELDRRMVGFKADPTGAFVVTLNGLSRPLFRVLQTLKVPAGHAAQVHKNADPQVPLQFVVGLPPKKGKEAE